MKAVKLTKMVEALNLKNMTPEVDMGPIRITVPDINRPALQLTGYFEHFASERVQIIGYVEFTYLKHMDREERIRCFETFISKKIPCVIFTTMTEPDEDMLGLARKHNVPVLCTERTTSNFMAEIIRWLTVQLAPCISIHGVLVDVYGEGVLIMGESGIGKSEAALELIKRGHRLVSDDVVEISKVSDETLVGRAPDITRHFIELRGIGIIDVKTLFGVACEKYPVHRSGNQAGGMGPGKRVRPSGIERRVYGDSGQQGGLPFASHSSGKKSGNYCGGRRGQPQTEEDGI